MMIFLLIAIIYINNFAEQANQIERTQERICSNIVDEFISKFTKAVDELKFGLPWEDGSFLTPLP